MSTPLRYLERVPPGGQRPHGTLVLVHAFPMNAHMFDAQLALAERGWRVIAPHLRGFGDNADAVRPDAGSMDDYAGDVVDLLDALHVQEAVIGGVSMGGYVAFAMLRHARRYFQGLVLADTRSQADTPEGKQARRQMLEMIARRGAAGVADDMVPKLLGATTQASRREIVDRVRALILSNSPDAIASAVHALMSRADSTPLLSKIDCPTLIVVGAEDTVTPPALAEEMHRGIRRSELTTIAAAGHLSSLEQPDAFNAALGRFLDRL